MTVHVSHRRLHGRGASHLSPPAQDRTCPPYLHPSLFQQPAWREKSIRAPASCALTADTVAPRLCREPPGTPTRSRKSDAASPSAVALAGQQGNRCQMIPSRLQAGAGRAQLRRSLRRALGPALGRPSQWKPSPSAMLKTRPNPVLPAALSASAKIPTQKMSPTGMRGGGRGR